jgi:hypothetical protein
MKILIVSSENQAIDLKVVEEQWGHVDTKPQIAFFAKHFYFGNGTAVFGFCDSPASLKATTMYWSPAFADL